MTLDALAAVEAAGVGDERLDQEQAVVGQMRCDVREAAQLGLLGRQAEQVLKTTKTSE